MKTKSVTHSVHQAYERGGLEHQGVKHLISFLSYVQQHYGEKRNKYKPFMLANLLVYLIHTPVFVAYTVLCNPEKRHDY